MTKEAQQTSAHDTQPMWGRPKRVAEHFDISEGTFWNWTKRPGFPRTIKAGPRVTLIDIRAVERFLAETATVSEPA